MIYFAPWFIGRTSGSEPEEDGSTPSGAANAAWGNGSPQDFGSSNLGSIPSAVVRQGSQAGKAPDCNSGSMGSNPILVS